MDNKWDTRFSALAQYVAEEWSKDPSTKVGAIAVGVDKTQVAIGYNGFPPGIEDDLDRLNDQEQRRLLMQHAERNVLDNATFDLRGATIYSTQYPCPQCSLSIVTKRIYRIVCPSWQHLPERKQLRGIQAASILREGNVLVDTL